MKKLFYLSIALVTLAQPLLAARSVVILGIDGMDPILLQQYVDEGRMPHFQRLMEEGSFSELGTSIPPQSPVAWSNFITGMNPGGHGIYDFIHRDPATYLPVFSTALVTEPEKTVTMGEWIFPIKGGKTELLRKGEAFWQILDRHGVPCTVFRIPANFPPTESKGKTISGMGTPDLLGSYGTFSYYTTDDLVAEIDVSGGAVYPVAINDNVVVAELVGPPHPLRAGHPELKRAFRVMIDPQSKAAKLVVGSRAFILEVGEWSEWIPVEFDMIDGGWRHVFGHGPFAPIGGIARFYLKSIDPYFNLYVTPIQIDPARPVMPLSTPADYAQKMYERIGHFYTQGMPEDTKALEYGMLDDGEFVEQTKIVFSERWKMLDAVLDDYQDGLLFFYVSTVDQSCHALWRNMDPAHPAHPEGTEFGQRITHLYEEVDSLLGVVRSRISEDATLIVMSDHGFAPYYKKFHLNTWLYQNDYLTLRRPSEMGRHPLLTNVFWRRTKAYALGINALYINQLGREVKGTVRAGQASEDLMDEIAAKLLAERDPETGEQIVTRVYKTRDIFSGDELDAAPDMIVGYNRGYRGSDASALGRLEPEFLTLNLGKWTGSHCMDHTKVPGILLSNRPIVLDAPELTDLTVTILNLYGIDAPDCMQGKPVLAP